MSGLISGNHRGDASSASLGTWTGPQVRAPAGFAHPAIWLAGGALSLWLRAGFPIVALGGAGADDALFIRLARSLAAGDWLGSYDNLTLAKGMFYPLFIAVTGSLSVPLKLAEQLVYLAASMLTALYVARQSGSRWLGTTLFVVLALNPVLWDRELARVIREGLYVSLLLAVVTGCVVVGFHRGRGLVRLGMSAGLGCLLAAFWLTREEGPWIAPTLAVIALLAMLRSPGQRLASLAASAVTAGVVFAASVGTVAAINGRIYGNAVTTEFHDRSFERAYGALAGIQQDHWQRYVVFPHDARLRAYAVSPAARALAPFFEGDGGEGWRRVGCQQSWVPRERCPEILAGWFMWALRDAVTATGQTDTARNARRFYQRLADEIGAACDNGSLACASPHRATLAPPFRWQYLADMLAPAKLLGRLVLTAGGGNMETPPSQGTPAQIAMFTELVGPVAPVAGAPAILRHKLQRWAASQIAMIYGHGLPILFGLGIVGLCAGLVRAARLPLPLLTLTIASLVAVASRIALLAYLDATAIPSANSLYVSPVVPFALIAAVLGCYLGFVAWFRPLPDAGGRRGLSGAPSKRGSPPQRPPP